MKFESFNNIFNISGWGTQSFGGADSDYLQKVNLRVSDQTSCTNSYGNKVTPRTMCTYTSGKDACQVIIHPFICYVVIHNDYMNFFL